MKTEYTREEVNKLLDGFVDMLGNRNHFSYLEQFKKDKGLLPQLEVGKWYKDTETMSLLYIKHIQGNNVYRYGFGITGEWYESNQSLTYSSTRVEATKKEVEEALIAEAKRRGFKEGVTVAWDGTVIINNLKESFTMSVDGGRLKENNSNWNIFKNGKWAEIIEVPEYTMEQLQDKLGHEFKIKK